MSKANGTEIYDAAPMDEKEPLTQEEILMQESDLLRGLLELDSTKDQAENYRKIQIKRNGAVKIEFRVRPLTEDEQQSCFRGATKGTAKKGKNASPEVDRSMFRSLLIYLATVSEDRVNLWDNKQALEKMGILRAPEMIDRVLLAGEKDRVIAIIEEISGYIDEFDAEEEAGN